MNKADHPGEAFCTDVDLARMVVRIAEVTQAQAIICVTATGAFAQHLLASIGQYRIIAATAIPETHVPHIVLHISRN